MDALVSTEWLAAELGAGDLLVFDCTTFLRRSNDGPYRAESGRSAWSEGHIPSSGYLDLTAELSVADAPHRFTALDADGLAAAFGARGIGNSTRVVLYDRAFNMWATRVWWLLRSIGFDSVAVLDGGWKAWTADGRETSTDPARVVAPTSLVADPRSAMIVGRAEVEAATTAADVCLINALSPQIHDGSDASYGRPGHIPSSSNVFAIGLVEPETHRYRPLEELRSEFSEAGVAGQRVVTWCGGGIAATSDAFVLQLLGHSDVGIYDGSLSEWIDAGLPLEA